MAQKKDLNASERVDTDIRTLSIFNVLLGAWLIATPYWFGYTSTAAMWDQTITGIIVLGLAALRAWMPSLRWTSTLTGLAGIWAIIAPFLLGYNRAIAYWNSVIIGIMVAVLAFYNSSLLAGDRAYRTRA